MANWVLGIFLFAVLVGGDRGGVSGNTCVFPAVYNFGDDNSDTGQIAAAFDNLDSPNGKTFFGKPSGRYCDGRLIIDFITEQLGVPFLSPYLETIGSNFSHGANFAMGGPNVLETLLNQIFQFIQFKSRTIALYNQLTDQ
ncbi:GDSL esterase/lipase, partial [Actinidia chinensis var. chinensis]